MVALAEVVTIRGGGTPSKKVPEFWGGIIPWASVKDFKSTELSITENYVTELGVENSATNVIPAGSIVVPTRMALGKVAMTTVDMAINQDLKALLIKNESTLDKRYLLRFLESKSSYIKNQGKGATVKGITLDVLHDMEIPLPHLAEQKRIAAILDKADTIRLKRQQAIQQTDEFLRAVFLDMFGDPVTNSKGWEVKAIKDLTSKVGSGATPRGGRSVYVSEGVSLIRSLNIHDDKFIQKDLAFITNQQAADLSNVVVQKDDVMLNITGASVCRTAIVDDSVLPARVNQHVCIIRPIEMSPEYLLHTLISQSYKKFLLNVAGASGATREALTKDLVEGLMIPVPPKDLQEKFSDIKKKLRLVVHSGELSLTEPLFESLSQKAFAGML